MKRETKRLYNKRKYSLTITVEMNVAAVGKRNKTYANRFNASFSTNQLSLSLVYIIVNYNWLIPSVFLLWLFIFGFLCWIFILYFICFGCGYMLSQIYREESNFLLQVFTNNVLSFVE